MTKSIKKYTKKASAYIMKYLLKEHPESSKLTSYDQAFVILMSDWDLYIDIYTNTKHHTKINLYRDEEIVKEFDWENIDSDEPADLDWNIIYKDVLETIIKKKLYKRPKLSKRAQKKLDEEKANQSKLATVENQSEPEAEPEVFVSITPIELTQAELKKKKSNLYQRIREWKKKGKDVTELVNEYNNICKKIK